MRREGSDEIWIVVFIGGRELEDMIVMSDQVSLERWSCVYYRT